MKINSAHVSVNPVTFQPMLNLNADFAISVEALVDLQSLNQLNIRTELALAILDQLERAYSEYRATNTGELERKIEF